MVLNKRKGCEEEPRPALPDRAQLRPIGVIRSTVKTRAQAPKQGLEERLTYGWRLIQSLASVSTD